MACWYVYSLCDPRNISEVRYVGCSQSIKVRLWHHKAQGASRVREWCKQLFEIGLGPCLRVLDQCECKESALSKEADRIIEFYSPLLLNTVLPNSLVASRIEGNSFNKELKKWRGKRRQKEAAEVLKVSLRTYQNWEQGENTPGSLTLAELRRRMA